MLVVGFSVNGSEPKLRLVIEHPDDVWLEDNFEDETALKIEQDAAMDKFDDDEDDGAHGGGDSPAPAG